MIYTPKQSKDNSRLFLEEFPLTPEINNGFKSVQVVFTESPKACFLGATPPWLRDDDDDDSHSRVCKS